jgi:hypothetical protein
MAHLSEFPQNLAQAKTTYALSQRLNGTTIASSINLERAFFQKNTLFLAQGPTQTGALNPNTRKYI